MWTDLSIHVNLHNYTYVNRIYPIFSERLAPESNIMMMMYFPRPISDGSTKMMKKCSQFKMIAVSGSTLLCALNAVSSVIYQIQIYVNYYK